MIHVPLPALWIMGHGTWIIEIENSLLSRLCSSHVSTAGDDFAFHCFLHIRASCARWYVEHRIQRIHRENVVMIRMTRRRSWAHVLWSTQAVLICSRRYRSALRNRRGTCRNIPNDPVRDVV